MMFDPNTIFKDISYLGTLFRIESAENKVHELSAKYNINPLSNPIALLFHLDKVKGQAKSEEESLSLTTVINAYSVNRALRRNNPADNLAVSTFLKSDIYYSCVNTFLKGSQIDLFDIFLKKRSFVTPQNVCDYVLGESRIPDSRIDFTQPIIGLATPARNYYSAVIINGISIRGPDGLEKYKYNFKMRTFEGESTMDIEQAKLAVPQSCQTGEMYLVPAINNGIQNYLAFKHRLQIVGKFASEKNKVQPIETIVRCIFSSE